MREQRLRARPRELQLQTLGNREVRPRQVTCLRACSCPSAPPCTTGQRESTLRFPASSRRSRSRSTRLQGSDHDETADTRWWDEAASYNATRPAWQLYRGGAGLRREISPGGRLRT